MLRRLDTLDKFQNASSGELRAFTALVRPILGQCVAAFDAVGAGVQPDPAFWGRICHYQAGGSGPSTLSGWITAFCVWSAKGKWQGPALKTLRDPLNEGERAAEKQLVDSLSAAPGVRTRPPYFAPAFFFEGVRYPVVATNDIPNGFCDVDVLLIDGEESFDCLMVSGHVGAIASGTGDKIDTLQPAPQWFMFIKEAAKPKEEDTPSPREILQPAATGRLRPTRVPPS